MSKVLVLPSVPVSPLSQTPSFRVRDPGVSRRRDQLLGGPFPPSTDPVTVYNLRRRKQKSTFGCFQLDFRLTTKEEPI